MRYGEVAAGMTLLLGASNLLVQPLLRFAVYPLQYELTKPRPLSIPHEKLSIRTFDGNHIDGALLRHQKFGRKWLSQWGVRDRRRNRKTKGVMVLSLPNAGLMEWIAHKNVALCTIAPWITSGYDVILFNPPGYGRSRGWRSPRSDLFAIEGVIQYLLEKNYQERSISIVGSSIGSGAAANIAQYYSIENLILDHPFDSLARVTRRLLTHRFGKQIASLICWATDRIIARELSYNNSLALKKSRARHLELIEGSEDVMMAKRLSDRKTTARYTKRRLPHKQSILPSADAESNFLMKGWIQQGKQRSSVHHFFLGSGHQIFSYLPSFCPPRKGRAGVHRLVVTNKST